jgi:hypothetical protein
LQALLFGDHLSWPGCQVDEDIHHARLEPDCAAIVGKRPLRLVDDPGSYSEPFEIRHALFFLRLPEAFPKDHGIPWNPGSG